MWKYAAMALALGLMVPTVQAGTPIHETRELRADGAVSVNNLAGRIDVVAWDRAEVLLTGELGEDVEALEVEGDAHKLDIYVRYPRKTRGDIEETILQLKVPAGASLDLEGVSADIRVSGVRGALSASSVSGDVRAQVDSARLKLNSVSGDVEVQAPARTAELNSVSGDITARGLGGSVTAETVSGDLQLAGKDFDEIAAQTVSGDLMLDVGMAPRGALRAETLSGEVVVKLAHEPNAKVSLKTFSGTLSSDLIGARGDERRKLEQTVGKGEGVIELNSFSGDIVLSR